MKPGYGLQDLVHVFQISQGKHVGVTLFLTHTPLAKLAEFFWWRVDSLLRFLEGAGKKSVFLLVSKARN